MKILVINCVSDRSEVALYKGLAARGVNLTLIADPREKKEQELLAAGLAGYSEFEIRNRLDTSAIRYIKKILAEGFDLVYAPTSRGVSTGILANLGGSTPFVTYRGTIGDIHYYNPASLLAQLNPRVNKIVCNCEAVKKSLREVGVPEAKLAVIYKGHETSWYQSSEKSDIRAQLGLQAGDVLFGCFGNARKKKGLELLFQALPFLKSQSNLHLMVVGDILENRSELLQMLKGSGCADRVHLMGFVTNVAPLMAECDFTVLPSLSEGVARAMVESLSLKVPVVITNVGGMPEVVRGPEDGGFIVPERKAESLALQILLMANLSKEKRAKLGDSGFQRVKEFLAVETYVNAYFSLFERLIAR